ncbi:MAG: XrtA system polysaccharide chain length determinant [Thioalkalivibrio sp.]
MHEIFGLILAYVRGMWRYRWLALGLAWAICIAGWLHVSQMPDQYQASARVHVDTDSMLRPLLRGLAVDTNIRERVNFMTRTLLTRPNLEKVARITDMHLDARTDAQMDGVIARLRSGISILGSDEHNLYTLSYSDANPERAHAVVQALLTIFVESALGDTRVDSDMAQRFIDQQIAEYEQRLGAAEQRLANFRRDNVGMLPGERGDYYQRMQQAQSQLEDARLRLREAENRRDEVQRQLAGEEPTFGIVGGGLPQAATSALDGRIQNMEQRLDEMLLSYTEQHPDVISLRRTLRNLERQKQQELALLAESRSGMADPQLDSNPVYQQMRMTLSNAEVEVSSLRVRVQEYQAQVDELQRMVDTIPNIEAELKRLDRDYSVNRENYEQLLRRRESASMSQSVEDRGEQVQFRVVDPARVPLSPSGPNRPMLFAAVLFLGLVAGAGLAFVVAQLRPVFDDRRLLNALTGFPVLGTVTQVMDRRTRIRERVELMSFASVTGALLVAFGLMVMLGGLQMHLVERLLG